MPSSRLFYYPILQVFAALQGCISPADLREPVARLLSLSPAQASEKTPSGHKKLPSRLYYALSKLHQHGLVKRVRRGLYEPTGLGISLFKEYPAGFDLALQKRIASKRPWDQPPRVPSPALLALYQLAPKQFEVWSVGYLSSKLCKNGGFVSHLGGSGDEGVDAFVSQDELALNKAYVQCKRWDPSRCVGREEIQKFSGALSGLHCRNGIFITTARLSEEARTYAAGLDANIVLIDGPHLERELEEN